MNRMITRKLRENAKILRHAISEGVGDDDLLKQKQLMLQDIYKMLTIHLGTPPTKLIGSQGQEKEIYSFYRYDTTIFLQRSCGSQS